MRGFMIVLAPAAIGGAVWESLGLPLGWLMGAAILTGAVAMSGFRIEVPKPLYALSLAALGASVGLSITPNVAMTLVVWAPVMIVAAVLGIAAAVGMTPVLSKLGQMEQSTAFFSLLPGGVIEMANVGDRYGANRTIVAALHAMRVGLVVGVLPLILFVLSETTPISIDPTAKLSGLLLVATLLIGTVGGWLATKAGLPAAWLLGALIAVGLVSATGALDGRMPPALLAVVQVFIGISLGARFQRDRLSSIPRALAIGLPVILIIMAVMALVAVSAAQVMPFAVPTLVLGFSIGGMAEMVLTSKALSQNVALVAAFQAVRAVLVNALAGTIWRRFASYLTPSDSRKG